MRKLKPTQEQAYSTEMGVKGNDLIINAYAGTGKSTNLEMIANALPHLKILYVTFGKENIVAARKSFPDNVYCATAHSLAYQYIDARLNLYKRKLVKPSISVSDFNNTMDITPEKGDPEGHVKHSTIALNGIVQYCRTTDTFIGLRHIPESSNRHIELSRKDKEIGLELARQYWDKACNGNAYLTHDMYLKMWQIEKPDLGYDLILFDEAQDADLLMVDVVNNQTCQKIVVGDDHQQIYSFRGAVNALNLFGIDRHAKLSQSWRYGPKIAELANKLIYAHKGINPQIRGNNAMSTEISPYFMPYDVMIGRTVSSIFEKMVEIYQGGYRDFTCLSDAREMSSVIFSIMALIYNSKTSNVRDHKPIYHPFIAGFDTYEDFKTYTRYAEGTNIATYQSIVSQHEIEDISGVLNHIKGKTKAETVFMTAHKCKGLEFDEVTLLSDFTNIDDDKYTVEETNLAYVAGTRAKVKLSIGDCDVLKAVL
jgi:hypothetical protein